MSKPSTCPRYGLPSNLHLCIRCYYNKTKDGCSYDKRSMERNTTLNEVLTVMEEKL